MKKLCVLLLPLAMVLCSASSDDCITKDGYFRGVRLCGKVKVVEFGADFMVKVVESFPDVKVKAVESFPDSPGEWKFVESGADFKVKFVESGADFTIKYVESFPGVNHPCDD